MPDFNAKMHQNRFRHQTRRRVELRHYRHFADTTQVTQLDVELSCVAINGP